MTRKPDQKCKPDQTGKPDNQDPLREQAEAKLLDAPTTETPSLPARELLHELEVHQIELEMQNEQLRQTEASLEASRDHYIDFYDFAPVGYITLDRNGLITEINLTGAALLGSERAKLLKRHLSGFIAPGDSDSYHRHFLQVINSDLKQSCELLMQREDGTKFNAQLDSIRLLREGHEPLIRVVLADITGRKQVEELVREQEEFFRMIAENTEDFIAVLDLQGRRLYNNPSYSRFFGDTEKLKGTDSFFEIHPEDREQIKRAFRQTVKTGVGIKADFRFVLPDGSIRHMESRGGLIRDSRGQAQRVVVVSRDITARKRADEEIRRLAFYDELTMLPNRRLLNDRLVQSMAASKRSGCHGALLFLDMDNFKPLNDRYGHTVGDLLLVEVARRIGGCVREVDTVARFGGDEFVVLLGELEKDKTRSATEAGVVAEKIRAALESPYTLWVPQAGKPDLAVTHRCTSSIGVVIFIDHEASAADILKWADQAMYQAKKEGRNRINFFDPKAAMEE